jgi:hypothetical protein
LVGQDKASFALEFIGGVDATSPSDMTLIPSNDQLHAAVKFIKINAGQTDYHAEITVETSGEPYSFEVQVINLVLATDSPTGTPTQPPTATPTGAPTTTPCEDYVLADGGLWSDNYNGMCVCVCVCVCVWGRRELADCKSR